MKYLCVYILALVFGQSSSDCDPGWSWSFGTDCFKFVLDDKRTYSDAEKYCTKFGADNAHLASCLSEDEIMYIQDKVQRLAKDEQQFYIGNNRWISGNCIANANGTQIQNQLPYAPQHPDESHDNQCFAFDKSGLVESVPCYSKINYICKSGPISCGPLFTCPEGWIQYGQTCLLVNHSPGTRLSFQKAIVECNSKNAQLFEDTGVSRVKFILDYTRNTTNDLVNFWLAMVTPSRWLNSGSEVTENWCRDQIKPSKTAKGFGYFLVEYGQYCYRFCDSSDCFPKASYVCEKNAENTNG